MNEHESALEFVAREYDNAGLYGIGRDVRSGSTAHAQANIAVSAVEAALAEVRTSVRGVPNRD